MNHTLAFFTGGIGPWEIVIVAVVALLIFGRRLPEVGKSLGKGIVEFKKGLSGIESDIDSAGSASDEPSKQLDSDPASTDVGKAMSRDRAE
ncbi:MAG: twin-arginine translocase TatA/TatE family subunit [Phycisphaeraceae bacterium]|nr:twin-arginine translocase TatA/TatE family subunit [Phycisphaeraceae bacterium]